MAMNMMQLNLRTIRIYDFIIFTLSALKTTFKFVEFDLKLFIDKPED